MTDEMHTLTVLYSPEDAALLHAGHARHGVWMSLNEIRLRADAERLGLSYLLRSPGDAATAREAARG